MYWPSVKLLPTQKWLHMEWAREQGTKNTHVNMWTLGAPLVSIHNKISNLSLKALKERFSTTKNKSALFLCIVISHREKYQIFTQEINVCKCSQTA